MNLDNFPFNEIEVKARNCGYYEHLFKIIIEEVYKATGSIDFKTIEEIINKYKAAKVIDEKVIVTQEMTSSYDRIGVSWDSGYKKAIFNGDGTYELIAAVKKGWGMGYNG